jgi:hypothetical protein
MALQAGQGWNGATLPGTVRRLGVTLHAQKAGAGAQLWSPAMQLLR